MNNIKNDIIKQQQVQQQQYEDTQQLNTVQNRDVDTHVDTQTAQQTDKTTQNKGDIQDTIQKSSDLSKNFSPQAMASSSRPQLTPPTDSEISKKGFTPQAPQADKNMSERANASNVMQTSSYQTARKSVEAAGTSGKDDVEKLAKDLQKALINPQNADNGTKKAAESILKDVSEKLQQLGMSPDEASNLINETLVDQAEIGDISSGIAFDKAFNDALPEDITDSARDLLNYAKDNPEFGKLLPDDLQSTFDDAIKTAAENTDPSETFDAKEDILSKSVMSNYTDKVADGFSQGVLSADDAQDLLRNLSPALLESAFNEAVGGTPDQKALENFLSDANDHIAQFKNNLNLISPPVTDEIKQEALNFLLNGQFDQLSTEAAKAFQEALPRDSKFSAETLRMADAYFNAKGGTPEGLKKEVSQTEQSALKLLSSEQANLKVLQTGDKSAFIAMLQSLGTPVGSKAIELQTKTTVSFLNEIKRVMKKSHIPPQMQAAVMNALKGADSPQEVNKIVDKLLQKVVPKFCSENGINPEDFAIDSEMIQQAELYLSDAFNALSNNSQIYMHEYANQFAATCDECSIDLVSAGPVPTPTTSSPQDNLTLMLNKTMNTVDWEKTIGDATSTSNQVLVNAILQDTQMQTMLQNMQRANANTQFILSQEANQKTAEATKQENKKIKSGPVGRFFQHVFEDVNRVFKVAIELAIAPASTIVGLIKNPKDVWNESLVQGISNDLTQFYEVLGLPKGVAKVLTDIRVFSMEVAAVVLSAILVPAFPIMGTILLTLTTSMLLSSIAVKAVNASNLPASVKQKVDSIIGVVQNLIVQVTIMVAISLVGGEEFDIKKILNFSDDAAESRKGISLGREVIDESEDARLGRGHMSEDVSKPSSSMEGEIDNEIGKLEGEGGGGEPTEPPVEQPPSSSTITSQFPTSSVGNPADMITESDQKLIEGENKLRKKLRVEADKIAKEIDSNEMKEEALGDLVDKGTYEKKAEKISSADRGLVRALDDIGDFSKEDLLAELDPVSSNAYDEDATNLRTKIKQIKNILLYVNGISKTGEAIVTADVDIATGLNQRKVSKILDDLAEIKGLLSLLSTQMSITKSTIQSLISDTEQLSQTLDYYYQMQQQRFRLAMEATETITQNF